MFSFISRQFYHTGKVYFTKSTNKSVLGKLRKVTGYSISNCKKALELFPDDLKKAEEWLHSEAKKMGWSKWNKIQQRSAIQGLIGLYAEKSFGVMVEVNCETDFVAKNLEFQQLVGNVLSVCLEERNQFSQRQMDDLEKLVLNENELMNLKCGSFNIQEMVNSAMCKFNEKTVVKRAVILKSLPNSNIQISGLTHPADSFSQLPPATVGKFGALVAYRRNEKSDEDMKILGINVCQHIIGMNPTSIGADDFLHLYESGKISIGDTCTSTERTEPEEVENEEEETIKKFDLKDVDESRLLFQSYLLDPNLHVYDYIWKHATILDFERFECGGESKIDEQPSKEASFGM